MSCRHCGAPLAYRFIDLGYAPPSNAYLTEAELSRAEIHYPLRLYVCERCWLAQTDDPTSARELFTNDYAYFSSTSRIWAEHAARYAADVTIRFGLGPKSFVVEIGSNDGYLLRHFVAAGVPCLGIEPTASTAMAAEALGVPVLREFFGSEVANRLAAERQQADLIVGNNVYAHVPDINDFTAGLKRMLKPGGTITLEFPHLLRLLAESQFDTVYHEHFSYLSLEVTNRIFAAAGLRVWDVDELPTHGGSLRVYGCHADDARATASAVANVAAAETLAGLQSREAYAAIQRQAEQIKDDLLLFLIEQKRAGKRVAAYGAAAKGNTLLNFAGVGPDLLPFVCDAAPSKQGKYLPGTHIPVLPTQVLRERKPDWVLILPWNIADEVRDELAYVEGWGGRLAVAVPALRVVQPTPSNR